MVDFFLVTLIIISWIPDAQWEGRSRDRHMSLIGCEPGWCIGGYGHKDQKEGVDRPKTGGKQKRLKKRQKSSLHEVTTRNRIKKVNLWWKKSKFSSMPFHSSLHNPLTSTDWCIQSRGNYWILYARKAMWGKAISVKRRSLPLKNL